MSSVGVIKLDMVYDYMLAVSRAPSVLGQHHSLKHLAFMLCHLGSFSQKIEIFFSETCFSCFSNPFNECNNLKNIFQTCMISREEYMFQILTFLYAKTRRKYFLSKMYSPGDIHEIFIARNPLFFLKLRGLLFFLTD